MDAPVVYGKALRASGTAVRLFDLYGIRAPVDFRRTA